LFEILEIAEERQLEMAVDKFKAVQAEILADNPG